MSALHSRAGASMQRAIERHGTTVLQFPPRPRRIEVRISATDGRAPVGRTRPLQLTERDLAYGGRRRDDVAAA